MWQCGMKINDYTILEMRMPADLRAMEDVSWPKLL